MSIINNLEIKTDNSWYHINDKKPNYGQEVLVVMERIESRGCSYIPSIQKSIYEKYDCKDYFTGENEFHKVRFWREITKYPYPNTIVKKEVEECKKNKIYPSILDYQKRLGYEYIAKD